MHAVCAQGMSLSVPVQVITHLAYTFNSDKCLLVTLNTVLMSLTASWYAHTIENY